jgi:NAD(P)-dependent dehydrogenase (short-subunit alcohol dehydrogenase family)
VAIVTGASSGLGVAAATALARAGADVALGARRTGGLVETAKAVEALGRRALVVGTDVTDPAACEYLAAKAKEELGRVDILLNNAGVASAVPALRETPKEFSRVVYVNLTGCFQMATAAARQMDEGGSIVNVSSVLGLTTAGLPQAAYASSKAALLGLTRDLAQQWSSRRGIRVNAICPGFFPSEMTGQYPEGYLDKMMERVLMGRSGKPEEFAATVVFLTGPRRRLHHRRDDRRRRRRHHRLTSAFSLAPSAAPRQGGSSRR